MSRRRAAVLIGVHVIIAIHVIQWKLTGATISPVEPSEAMQTLEQGRVNAGFIFFVAAILATLIFGRFFCGWACHVVALQDLCGSLMKRAGIKPRPFRSRLLAWIPLGLAVYMFAWPTLERVVVVPLLQRVAPPLARLFGTPAPFPGFSSHLVETSFWQTFPGVAVAIPFLLVCGFAVVYFMGAKGFCTYGCPYGGVFGPVDRLAPGKIVADLDACEGCGHCTATCTSNVRVHEEIQVHRMVVDSGCMKCMDCVSVCPNDALSFGFTRPTAFAGAPLRPPKPRRHDLSWREEVMLAAVFLGSFLAVRGAYDLIPMLMAVGVGLTATYLSWLALKLLRSRSVSIHRTSLKHAGALRPAGAVALASALLVLALVVHTGIVTYHAWRGDQLDRRVNVSREAIISGTGSPAPEMRELASRAQAHYARARSIGAGGLGLLDTPEIAFRSAWLDLVLGERERARATLEALFDDAPSDGLALEIGTLIGRDQGPDAAAAFYRRALERDAAFVETRAALGALLLSTSHVEEAVVELARAVESAPGDPALRNDYAVALFMSGRHTRAIEEMARAAALDPDDASLGHRLEEMRRQATPGR